MLSTGFIGRCL